MNPRTILIAALAGVLGAGVAVNVIGTEPTVESARLFRAESADAGYGIEVCLTGAPCVSFDADVTSVANLTKAAKEAYQAHAR